MEKSNDKIGRNEQKKQKNKYFSSVTKREQQACLKRGYNLQNKYLGGGASGRVFLASVNDVLFWENKKLEIVKKKIKKANIDVAIKIIYTDVGFKFLQKYSKYIPNEIHAMNKLLGHPNIITLLDVFVSCKRIFLVCEYAEKGSLQDIINNGKQFNESEVWEIFLQILIGVKSLHSLKISHRDLKLENILITESNQVKIADFGLAIDITYHRKKNKKGKICRDHYVKTLCGTPAYVAPEVLESKFGYNPFFADVWSLGVILFVLLNRSFPFKGDSYSQIATLKSSQNNIKLNFKAGVSEEAKDLVEKCLYKNPEKRLGLTEILHHQWICNSTKSRQKIKDFLSNARKWVEQDAFKEDNLRSSIDNEEKIVKSYIFQRCKILQQGLSIMEKEEWAPIKIRQKYGVCIPLPHDQSSDGKATEEVWRIYGACEKSCKRPLDRIGDKENFEIDAKFDIDHLSCECRKKFIRSSFAQPTITRVLYDLPIFRKWRAIERSDFSPATNIERCLKLCNTVELGQKMPKKTPKKQWLLEHEIRKLSHGLKPIIYHRRTTQDRLFVLVQCNVTPTDLSDLSNVLVVVESPTVTQENQTPNNIKQIKREQRLEMNQSASSCCTLSTSTKPVNTSSVNLFFLNSHKIKNVTNQDTKFQVNSPFIAKQETYDKLQNRFNEKNSIYEPVNRFVSTLSSNSSKQVNYKTKHLMIKDILSSQNSFQKNDKIFEEKSIDLLKSNSYLKIKENDEVKIESSHNEVIHHSSQNQESSRLLSSKDSLRTSKNRSSSMCSSAENKLKENSLNFNKTNYSNTRQLQQIVEDVKNGKIAESSSVVKMMVDVFKKFNKSSNKSVNEISEIDESLRNFWKDQESISLVNSVMENLPKNLQNDFYTNKSSKVEGREDVDRVTKVHVSNFASHLKPDSFKKTLFEEFNNPKESERFNRKKKNVVTNISFRNNLQPKPESCFLENFQNPQIKICREVFAQKLSAKKVSHSSGEAKSLKSNAVDNNFETAKNGLGSGDLNMNLFNLRNELNSKCSSISSNASLYKKIKTKREKLKNKMKQFIKGIKIQA